MKEENQTTDEETMTEDQGQASSLIPRTIVVKGARTTMRLEPELWDALYFVARGEGKELPAFLSSIKPGPGTFTSRVRSVVVRKLCEKAGFGPDEKLQRS